MSISFLSFGNSPGESSTTCVINKPSGLSVGDFMLAHVVGDGASTISAPDANWTLLQYQSVASTTNISGASFWKWANSADTSASTFIFTFGTSRNNKGAISRWSGVDPVTPVNNSNSNVQQSVVNETTTGITPSLANCEIVLLASTRNTSTFSGYDIATSDPTSWTERYDEGTVACIGMAHGPRAETTDTGTSTVVNGTQRTSVPHIIALNTEVPNSSSSSSSSVSSSSSSSSYIENYSSSSSSSGSSSSSSYLEEFRFTITTTSSPQNFTLPLTNVAPGHNFIVYWGDTTSSTVTAYNDANRIHSYATAGTYTVAITGICSGFQFANGGDKTLIKTILSWGNVGFKRLDFSGCSALTTLPSEVGKLTGVTTFYNFCANCTALTAIPSGIFDDNITTNSFEGAFYGCNNAALTSIPAGLFNDNTAVLSFSSTFNGCTKITSIPSGLFTYNTLVTTFNSTFASLTSLTAIPANLFDTNTEVTNFGTLFWGCNNAALTSIPSGLFNYNTKATAFSLTFNGCSKLTAIPSGLFTNCTLVTTYASCFNGCTSLTGAAPTLWKLSPEPTGTTCFTNDTGLSNYNDIPETWGGPTVSSSSSSSYSSSSSSTSSEDCGTNYCAATTEPDYTGDFVRTANHYNGEWTYYNSVTDRFFWFNGLAWVGGESVGGEEVVKKATNYGCPDGTWNKEGSPIGTVSIGNCDNSSSSSSTSSSRSSASSVSSASSQSTQSSESSSSTQSSESSASSEGYSVSSSSSSSYDFVLNGYTLLYINTSVKYWTEVYTR